MTCNDEESTDGRAKVGVDRWATGPAAMSRLLGARVARCARYGPLCQPEIVRAPGKGAQRVFPGGKKQMLMRANTRRGRKRGSLGRVLLVLYARSS